MKLQSIIAAACAACLMSSCSLFAPKCTTVSGAEATASSQTSIRDDNRNNSTSTQEIKNIKDKSTSSGSSTAAKTTEPQTVNDAALAGEWMITTVHGQQLKTVDEMPYINFDDRDGRFYSSNGCNVLNGSYTVGKDKKLTLGNVLSTMKLCNGVQFEAELSEIMSGSEPLTYKVEKIGHESYLKLYNTKGIELMTARKHNMNFLSGNWLITSVKGKSVNDEEANLFIDISELKVHGNTGCNFFNGELYINPDRSNAIDFSNMATTRMACPKMEQEAAILLALEETAAAIQGGSDKVILLNADGKELMTLKKTEIRPEE